MKRNVKGVSIIAGILAIVGIWLIHFHNHSVAAALPKWSWLQGTVTHFGEAAPEEPSDEDPDNTKNEIPVKVAKVTTTTLHRYLEGTGVVTARPARAGQMAGGSSLSVSSPGIVATILCEPGQLVHTGDQLLKLDDRIALAQEAQARASLAQAEASLAALIAPRTDQIEIAQLTVDKARAAAELAQSSSDRLSRLATSEGTSAKSLQQAHNDLAAARIDLATAEHQLALVKLGPTQAERVQEDAKVAQAKAALSAATAQREQMTLIAPIDATVMAINANPGELIDSTKTVIQLIALDRLSISMSVPADQLPPNARGLTVEVFASASTHDESPTTSAIVATVSPQVDVRNGAVVVLADLPPDSPLRPGSTVRARIVVETHKDCLVVPRASVVTDENGDSVISIVEGDQATHKSVTIGLDEGNLIEVIADGLKPGVVVVTAGAFGLPQASRVKVVD